MAPLWAVHAATPGQQPSLHEHSTVRVGYDRQDVVDVPVDDSAQGRSRAQGGHPLMEPFLQCLDVIP